MRLFTIMLLFAGMASAAMPVVTIPAEVSGDIGTFVVIRATVTDAKVVKFLPLDAGLTLFPAEMLNNSTLTVVVAKQPGRYRVLAYSGNADGVSDPVITTVVIGNVKPVEPPAVDPNGLMLPQGFRVLILYSSDGLAALPPTQLSVLTSDALRADMSTRCVKGADNITPEWRVYPDSQVVDGVWKDMMNVKRTKLPWIVIGNGKNSYSGPLPGNVVDTLSLIKKYGDK